jgi:hypothetical protein
MNRTWFTLFALVLLWGGVRAEAASYWCEPLRAYYPWVRSCPSPWQAIDPQFGAQPLAIPPAQNASAQNAAAGDAAQPQQTGSTENHQPTFPGRSSFVRGDALDEWCKGSTTALLTAICGDDQLRALAIERLHAFDDAKSRLTPDRQKTLIADQNGWALSYPTACGLNADVQPSLPLEPSLRDCLAKAGQARLQYLKDYGQTKPENTASPPTTLAPTAPAPATPAPAPPAPSASTGPAGTQSPTTAAAPAPAAPQNNEAHQAATAAVPPAATPSKPAPSDTGSAAAPQRNSSLSKIGDYARTGAMLIAVIVVFIWAITAWLQGRSRRAGKTAETRR